MTVEELLAKPLPKIPPEIRAAIEAPHITMTEFADKNDVLTIPNLREEVGWRPYDQCCYLVSMTCPMPGVTADMVDWWFWWHAKNSVRYQEWFPGAHYRNTYSRKDVPYFERDEQPPFQPNAQYPKETIGGRTAELIIRFVTPEQFGFDKTKMRNANVATIVCGHVGVAKGLVMHTEMTHVFFQADGGLFLASRFWMGELMRPGIVKRRAITEGMAKGMAEHCAVEYRNLAQILPGLYAQCR